MILTGLLPDTDHSQSILKLSLRDPGGNMREGHRPMIRRAELPLTKPIAAAAITGTAGVDVEGYRDYQASPPSARGSGSPSTAWAWLPRSTTTRRSAR